MNIFAYNLDLLAPEYNSPEENPLPLLTLNLVYRATVDRLDFRQRLSLIKGIVDQVRSRRVNAFCLLSVAMVDHEPEIIDLALSSFLRSNFPDERNPLGACDAISYMLRQGDIRNPGAVHASLACFGDRRLCSLLKAHGIRTAEMIDENFFEAMCTERSLKQATLDYLMETLVSIKDNDNLPVDQFSAAIAAYVVSGIDSVYIEDSDFNFGSYCFPHEISRGKRAYDEFLEEIRPLLQHFETSDSTALNRLATVLKDPLVNISLEQLKIKLRSDADRRGGDRRVVNMIPMIDRRSRQRREVEERRHSMDVG